MVKFDLTKSNINPERQDIKDFMETVQERLRILADEIQREAPDGLVISAGMGATGIVLEGFSEELAEKIMVALSGN